VKTTGEVEQMQAKAVRFLTNVVGDPDKASEFEAMTPEEYAAHKKITIRDNPEISRRRISMAAASKAQVNDLNDQLDDIQDILDNALDPELSREEVVAKVKEAYGIVSGDDSDDDDSDDSDDGDDDTEN
jgi:hypothetical protein